MDPGTLFMDRAIFARFPIPSLGWGVPLEFWTKLGARPPHSKTKGPDPTRFHRVGSGPPHFIPICHEARGVLPIMGGPLRLVLLAISYPDRTIPCAGEYPPALWMG